MRETMTPNQDGDMEEFIMKVSSIRSRAAVGAAVAVSLGAGGTGITHATTSSGEKPVYIPLDSPCRLADNRPAGIGPDASVTFDGWGTVGDCTLPTGTAGLALNVTAVDATQQTNLRFYPADTAVPGTANLNPTPGAPPIPNAVNVSLASADGKFKVYNRFGNVAVIIDVMGVYDDHNHDDRYYTEAEADAVHATKANAADVYTKTEADAAHATKADADDVAALPGAHIFAAGRVSPSGAKSPLQSTELGDWSVTRDGAGDYTLSFPFDCSGTTNWPLVQLTLGFNESAGGFASLGAGNCVAPNLTFDLRTFDAAGTQSDQYWMFTAIGPVSQLNAPAAAAPVRAAEAACAVTDDSVACP